MGLRIEAGKFYRTRDGRKVGPVVFRGFTLNGRSWEASGCHYQKSGRVYEGQESQLDIVAEWRDDPDFAEVAGATDTPLKLEADKLYLDADGFVHGPMVQNSCGSFRASAVDRWWRPDGTVGSGSPHARDIVAEWIPPVPQFAAEENEHLRHECDRLTGKVDLLTQERDSANDRAMAIFRRKNELLGQIEGLKHDVEMHRDAASDLASDGQDHLDGLRIALGYDPSDGKAPGFSDLIYQVGLIRERNLELRRDVNTHREAAADAIDNMRKVASRFLLALHAACVEAGVSVPSEDVEDEESVYGHLVDGIRAMRRDIVLHEDIAAEIKAESPGPGYTAVHVPTDRLEEFSNACSDLGCWMRGYVAGLPRDEFGNVTDERQPMGRYVITEINIALKSALERADAEKKS